MIIEARRLGKEAVIGENRLHRLILPRVRLHLRISALMSAVLAISRLGRRILALTGAIFPGLRILAIMSAIFNLVGCGRCDLAPVSAVIRPVESEPIALRFIGFGAGSQSGGSVELAEKSLPVVG